MDLLRDLLLAAVPVILAITLHEAAHGFAALAMGDDTARRMGRLSLNPIRHIDRFGTIILPGFLLISQLLTIHRIAFMFGWAKPVPVDARRFRNPRQGMMIVAAAGPAMNFLLAWLGALAFYALPALPPSGIEIAASFLFYFILSNLVLGLFNLIPIPPLDGGRIVVGLLPPGPAMAWARLERAGILIVILLVFLLPSFLAEFGIAFDPVRDALGTILPWAFRLVLRAAGHGSPDAFLNELGA
jgi:Zn-dependent protease